jgi:membrane protease YdiL (CAAX protease family)
MKYRRPAIITSMVLSALAAVFQVFYGLGFFAGLAWGGAKQNSTTMIASFVSALILLAIAGHYASMLGWLPSLLNEKWQRRAEIALLMFFTLEFAANLISPSSAEQLIWVPVTAVLFVTNLTIVWAKPKA